MAKKLSGKLVVFCFLIFLVIGAVLGVAGQIFVFAESYEIPAKEQAIQHIAVGDTSAEVIKNQDLSIHFVELGNKYTGDCTLIKVGSTEVLIDAGSRASSVQPIYDYVSDYVDGILDYVIVTHAHQDHYAGFATENGLFDKFNIGTIVTFSKTNQKETAKLYSAFKSALGRAEQSEGVLSNVYTVLECYNSSVAGAEREYNLGNNVSLQFLYQEFYETKAPSENDYSVCCMINQNDTNYYLFTGDLEKEGEESLVTSYRNEYGVDLPKVVLYKAGHHGSKTSSSDALLSKIDPDIVCVCCCAGSSEYTSNTANQFPTQEFINRIAPHTSQVYVTTLCLDYNKGSYQSFNGNIVVYANASNQVSVACANNNMVLKDTEWFKNNRTCPDAWKS